MKKLFAAARLPKNEVYASVFVVFFGIVVMFFEMPLYGYESNTPRFIDENYGAARLSRHACRGTLVRIICFRRNRLVLRVQRLAR